MTEKLAVDTGSVFTSATRREPLPGGSEPASMRATVAELHTGSVSATVIASLRKKGQKIVGHSDWSFSEESEGLS